MLSRHLFSPLNYCSSLNSYFHFYYSQLQLWFSSKIRVFHSYNQLDFEDGIIAWIMLTTHLVTLESFGVPYAAPFAPLRFSDLKDTIIKVHPSYMLKRPESARAQDKQRQVPKREN